MHVEFIATVAVIAADPEASRRLYVDALGLPLQSQSGGDYVWTDKLDGAKHFAVWPLSQAAEACFGTSEWPADRPVPQASIEFELADVESVRVACDELEVAGHALLHPPREEPWVYDGRIVLCLAWTATVSGEPRAGDDLTELRWFDPDELPDAPALAFSHYPAVLSAALEGRRSNHR